MQSYRGSALCRFDMRFNGGNPALPFFFAGGHQTIGPVEQIKHELFPFRKYKMERVDL